MTAPTRVGLRPGQLDRDLLCRAITFALDSVRAGQEAAADGFWAGQVGTLTWDQSEWVHETDCGTSCCIAGWIALARAEHPLTLEVRPGRTADVAVLHRVGTLGSWAGTGWAGDTDPHDVYNAIDELFSGGNSLNGVIVAADRLLRVCGHEPMQLTPEGAFV